MFKKFVSVVLMLLVILSCLAVPVSAQEKKLSFGEDGKFRILQINDFQDTDATNAESLRFLNAALDKYKPDLVVLVGDQIRNGFKNVTVEKIKVTLTNQLMPIQERGIPFLFTFGNHDRDYINIMPMEQQAEFYRSFSYCYANTDGADGGTYNTVIYGKDGKTPVLNIYMMDTQQWDGKGWTSGVTAEQVEWYVQASNALTQANGGKVVPALVFQHIPVKEILQLTKVVPSDTPGAVKDNFYNQYIVLDENANLIGDRNVMGEAPACEHPEKVTGQYEAWLSQGDVMGAYFGHEHINTFTGVTDDGIVLGYNGGFGFASYGDPGERYATVYDFDESNVRGYTEKTIYYTECIRNDEPVVPDEPEKPTKPETSEQPDTPDEPEETTKNCEHMCHKQGFMSFIWKIVNFFQKLFKMNPVCECGVAHY